MKHHLTALLICSALLCACQPELPDQPRRLVIEGYYNSGAYPDVMVSLSMAPTESDTDVSSALLSAATVTISDDQGQSTILTGSYSNAYLPPYHYFNYQMQGKPGHYYTITARYRTLTASSTAYMPYPTPIDSITQATVPGDPAKRALTLHFTAPDDCPAYYHISLKVDSINQRFVSANLGTAEVYTPGIKVSIPVLRSRTYNANEEDDHFSANFNPGRTVAVRLERIDRPAYDFWKAHANALLFGASEFFDSSFSLPGNITDGYGIWSPAGASTTILHVE